MIQLESMADNKSVYERGVGVVYQSRKMIKRYRENIRKRMEFHTGYSIASKLDGVCIDIILLGLS